MGYFAGGLPGVCTDNVSTATPWCRRCARRWDAWTSRVCTDTATHAMFYRSRAHRNQSDRRDGATMRLTLNPRQIADRTARPPDGSRCRPVVLSRFTEKRDAQLGGQKERHRETPCRPTSTNHLLGWRRVTLRLPLRVASLSVTRCGTPCPRWTCTRAARTMSTTTLTHPTIDAQSILTANMEGPADA